MRKLKPHPKATLFLSHRVFVFCFKGTYADIDAASFSNARGTQECGRVYHKAGSGESACNIVLSASRSFKADGSRPSESTVHRGSSQHEQYVCQSVEGLAELAGKLEGEVTGENYTVVDVLVQ